MNGRRYYYSVDGSAVRGPVGADVIRKLCEQRMLTAASLVCPEGANEWQQLEPESFAPSLARSPRPGAPLARPVAQERRSTPQVPDQSRGGIGRLSFLLGYWCCMALAFHLRSLPHISGVDHLLALVPVGGILVVLALRLENIGHSRWWCLLAFCPPILLGLALYGISAPAGSAGVKSKWLPTILLGTVLLIIFLMGLLWYIVH